MITKQAAGIFLAGMCSGGYFSLMIRALLARDKGWWWYSFMVLAWAIAAWIQFNR